MWRPGEESRLILTLSRSFRPIRRPAAKHWPRPGDLSGDVLPSALRPHPSADEGGGHFESNNCLDGAAARLGGEVQVGPDL